MSRLRTQPRAQTEAATRFRACQSRGALSGRTAQSFPGAFSSCGGWTRSLQLIKQRARSAARCCPVCSGTRGDSSELVARWASWIREGNKAATTERGLFSIKLAWSSPASWPRTGTMQVPKKCTWRCSINCSAHHLYLLQRLARLETEDIAAASTARTRSREDGGCSTTPAALPAAGQQKHRSRGSVLQQSRRVVLRV